MEWETVIGLEIHAQLKTNTKIFCGCETSFGDDANSHGCPVCLGLPGALPVLNRRVVEMAVLAGLATDHSINEKSIFARKNYFYPDLPKGYQISQYDLPICENGKITVNVKGKEKTLGITRIHLEEDAGKLIHDQDVDSLFDVNRCGTPLIEIVSEPEMRSGAEAYAYLTSIKKILEYLDVSDCNMEEGSLRCDVNISLRPKGETKLGTKTELKNMNSFRAVEKAIEYEVMRQADILESGGSIIQQTFLWDPDKNVTVPMRTKEDAHDYRYFPEPDLVPLVVESGWVSDIKEKMPELPQAKLERFMSDYSLSQEHAETLTDSIAIADYFEQVAEISQDSKSAASWVMQDVLRIIKEKKIEVDELALTPQRLGVVVKKIKEGAISAKAAKTVVNAIEEQDKDPEKLIEELGLSQISDSSELEGVVKKLIEDNPDEAQRLKDGDKKLTGFFVGQAMKATKGKGNPKEINRLLAELLK